MNVNYEPSRKLCEQYATSFYAAAQFLPADKKNAAYALYGFCRYTDNIVDGEGTVEYKRKYLLLWKNALHAMWENPYTHHAILHAFVQTCREYRIPKELGFALIEGLENDLKKSEHADFDELYTYCYAAGGIPGLFMAYVSGAPTSAYPAAVSLGIGMQLTNILRDLKEDAQRGRVYLPLNEMNEHGYTIHELKSEKLTNAFHSLMEFQIQRAHTYYAEAEKALPFVDSEVRLALELSLSYYREILAEIETHNHDVFSTRIHVSEPRKSELLAAAIAKLLRQAERLKDPVHE